MNTDRRRPSDVSLSLELLRGFVGKILIAGIGFAGTILFARFLGPTSFGGYFLLFTVTEFWKLPIAGFAQSAKKRFSETNADRDAIVTATLIVTVGLGGVGTVFAYLFGAQLTDYTGVENAPLLFALMFVTAALFIALDNLLAGTGRVSLTIWIDLLRSLFTTPLQLVLVLLGLGVTGMVLGISIATSATIPVSYYYLRTSLTVPSKAVFRRLWSYARFSILAATASKAYSRLDSFLLGLILTPAAAGQYEVALKLTLPAMFVSQITGSTLMAKVSNLDTDDQSVATDITNTVAFSSIFAFPMFFGGLVVSKPLVVTLYGPEYAAAAPLIVGLALFRVLQSQTTPLKEAINGLDRPDLNVKIGLGTVAINAVLGVALTLEYGLVGVVIATVLSEALRYGMTVVTVRRLRPNMDPFSRTIVEQGTAAGVMALVVFVAHQVVPVASWIHLLGLLGLGAGVYGALLISISPKLRLTVRAVLEDVGFAPLGT